MTGPDKPLNLHVEIEGDPAGAPVVMIHGFLSSNAQWMLNRSRLSERYRLLLVELPGHGSSPAPASAEDCSPQRIIAALEKIRLDAGLDRWFVIGQSLGGAIALNYALAHQSQIRGLVFTNSRAVFGITSDRPGDERARAIRQFDPERQGIRDIPVHPIHAKRFPAEVKEAMVASADAMDPRIARFIGSHRDSWKCVDRLGELEHPVLLVNGRWEKAFQPCVPQARAAFADLDVVDLEGGHSINVEQAEGFDAAVVTFFDRLVASGR